MADHIVDLSTKHESLKDKLGSYDENWLEKSKTTLLKQFHCDERGNFIMSRMQKQIKNNEERLQCTLLVISSPIN